MFFRRMTFPDLLVFSDKKSSRHHWGHPDILIRIKIVYIFIDVFIIIYDIYYLPSFF